MRVLGISAFAHEASACLLDGDRVVALVEEERLNRERHTSRLPTQAVDACLRLAGATFADVERIGFFWRPWAEVLGNARHVLQYFPASLRLLTAPSGGGDLAFSARFAAMRNVGKLLAARYAGTSAPPVDFHEHHRCHAASAYYASRFEEAAILVVDGRGEAASTSIWRAENGRLTRVLTVKVPHSLGHLYAAITDHLGLHAFSDEWKVMGLAGYGSPNLVAAFRDLVRLDDKTGYRLDLRYTSFQTHGSRQWLSPRFGATFGPRRDPSAPWTSAHQDLAYALQSTVEAAGVHLAGLARRLTGKSRLCVSGGVALNCLMNRRIMLAGAFDEYYFQPLANDAGTSLGAAALTAAAHHRGEYRLAPSGIYLGPSFSDAAIEAALAARGLSYRRSSDVARDAARRVADGQVVGWFQGRMEAGPRALGNRSILASPRHAAMKDTLNARVKKREYFRPFAPSTLAECAADYFELPRGTASPHMILAGTVRPEQRGKIPAVTHVDGTARVQTVEQAENPLFWRLISEVGALTGVPVVINTSFNESEPIVCTPDHAIDCFLRTHVEALAIGNFVVDKTDQSPSAFVGADA